MTTDFDDTMAFMKRVLQLKKKMMEKKITYAKTTCTVGGCEGEIVARLAGRKNHVHAGCATCNRSMME